MEWKTHVKEGGWGGGERDGRLKFLKQWLGNNKILLYFWENIVSEGLEYGWESEAEEWGKREIGI